LRDPIPAALDSDSFYGVEFVEPRVGSDGPVLVVDESREWLRDGEEE